MRLLEYESKQIIKRSGIAVPASVLVGSPNSDIPLSGRFMVKAQVPVGGRGKTGGVLETSKVEDARVKIAKLLAEPVRTYQATRVLVEEKKRIQKEYYLAVTYDTVRKMPVSVFSDKGGIDIEEIALSNPEAVVRKHFSARTSLLPYQARELVACRGITGKLNLSLGSVLHKLADIFLGYDATIAEINPLALTEENELVALDCHIDIDDDALYRQNEIREIAARTDRYVSARGKTRFERSAEEINNLDHRGVAGRMVEFDGNLGLIIGGGGASLTVFDAVRAHGGRPANYCEIGGNPSVLKVKELTKLILSKPGVEKIAVIMNVVNNTRVDIVARGVVKGLLELGRDPATTVTVFRIPGAWEDEGFKILSKYKLPFKDRKTSIDEAARIAVDFAS